MANYILVHGGHRDGSIWTELSTLLKKRGHAVYCPSMRPIKNTSLEHNINEIIDLIHQHGLEDVILVGHSYGAMVVVGVVNTLPEHIAQIILIDSVLPQNGYSLYETLANNGYAYQKFGLEPDQACLDKLYFDTKKVFARPKTYVHCLQSEFLPVLSNIYEAIKTDPSWHSLCLDTTHACMLTQPAELSIILQGILVFS